MNDVMAQVQTFLATTAIDLGVKILGALAFWIIGRWLIRRVTSLVESTMGARRIDATLVRYTGSILGALLNIVLIIGILGFFGVQTTSFAALLAGVGIALGAAWGGLLGNFAAGAFLLILRPFKTGDLVNVGGVTGVVRELGIFGTTLVNDESVQVTVGNNKVFSGDIINYSAQPVRRVDRTAQIAGAVDPNEAISRLRAEVEKIANVATTPKVAVDLLDFNPAGAVISVRPYTSAANYWQVYFDTNKAIAKVVAESKWPTPAPTTIMKQG